MADWINGILRGLFFEIDKIIYGFIDVVYSLVLQLARTTIFDSGMIETFSKRIYAFIGIFMLFKVSISLLTYVLHPDDFSDKEKGFTSVIKRIILSLVLVVIVPYIFAEAYKLQTYILEDNTLLTLVFGTPTTDAPVSNSSYTDVAGKKLQFTILFAFVQPNYEQFTPTQDLAGSKGPNLDSCRNSYKIDDDGKYMMRETPVINTIESRSSGYIYALDETCWGIYDSAADVYTNGELQALFGTGINSTYQNYAQGVAQQDYSMFFTKELIKAQYKESGIERYIIDYKWGLSTIAGVAVLYLLLLFCIDIAIRSVKLGFLQMISPIPIISYCDPKSGKMFKKWVDMCVKTYLDLFIRLFALYFGIYVISLIGTYQDIITGETVDNWVVKVFIIIGVLIFAKKLPEILKDVFGFTGDMKFNLNPLKRLEEEAIVGKPLASGLRRGRNAALGVPLVGAASFFTGHGLRGMGSAFMGGLKGEKFGKNFSNSYGAARLGHKRTQEMHADGVSGLDVAKAKFYNATHGQTRAEHVKNVTAGLKAIQDDYASYEKTAAGVDAIAKEMDKRKKAAAAAGDYAAEKKWADAFDERVKQIAINGGEVAKKFTGDLTRAFDAQGNYNANGINIDDADKSTNAALKNIAKHMDGLAEELNKQGKDIAGYQEVTGSTSTNIKAVKNAALGSQQAVETNAANRKIEDIAKYANGDKK